jgi:hypothetical protein
MNREGAPFIAGRTSELASDHNTLEGSQEAATAPLIMARTQVGKV